MTINQKGSNGTRIPVNTINTIIEQISDLQEDLGITDAKVNNLENGLSNTNSTVAGLNQDKLNANKAVINNLTATKVNTANVTASNGNIDTITAKTVKAGNVVLDADNQKVSAQFGNINELKTITGTITNLAATKVTSSETITSSIVTNLVVNTGNYSGDNVTVKSIDYSDNLTGSNAAFSGTTNVKDLNVTGTITGVADIELDNVKTNNLESETVKSDKVITDTVVRAGKKHLAPISPILDNNDRYTIELPVFTGIMYLTWKDNDTVWDAVVTGNSENYSITWSTVGNEVQITNLFQYDNKLYVRTLANGSLYYNSNTTEQIGPINIYYNMGGWGKEESLEELCDEKHQIACKTDSSNVAFGSFIALDLTYAGKYTFDDLTANKLVVNSYAEIVPKQIIWNNVDISVCDNFTTDWVL